MSLLREVLFSAAQHIDNTSKEWVSTERSESDGHEVEIVKFRAKRVHNRATTIYESVVKIKDNSYISVKNPHGTFDFLKSDIVGMETKMICFFPIFFTVFPILLGVLMLIGLVSSFMQGDGVPLSHLFITLLLFASPIFTALIRTIKIKLKNGSIVKVYYNTKEDPAVLFEKLKG
ncbi:MAG: hypothetical protein IJF32_03510 [Oscillospiraceae bacterium]|nr:hypothetical protein [Oscillospiraceae bacterium]